MNKMKENGVTHKYSVGTVSLNEFLKDANIPPPIHSNGKKKNEEIQR